MLFGESLGDPNDCDGFKPCRISEELAKVSVVRPFELVLDENPGAVHCVLTEDVGPEGPYILFLSLQFQVKADGITEELEVLLMRQPGGKVLGFTCPYLSKGYSFKAAQVICCHLASSSAPTLHSSSA